MNANNPVATGRTDETRAVRLHLTNIVGLGAVRLLQSLLPALVNQSGYKLEEVYFPARGEISKFMPLQPGTVRTFYKRYLPNSISRLLECTLLGGRFDGAAPLLVFGDIPIRCRARQTVFVQTSLLVQGADTSRRLGAVKYWVARWLFRRNCRYASSFIVQTHAMKASLIESYPKIGNRVHVIAQPAPAWLIDANIRRTEFHRRNEPGLKLFYPAAPYPHKNHRILSGILQPENWPIAELILTIPQRQNPNPSSSWIRCVDHLEPDEILKIYRTTDALLFLSLSESFGFPLVEAMWVGLPVICPDRPYARALCNDQAIYFDPLDAGSLHAAVTELGRRRDSGWWPDWSSSLEKIPRDWNEVANAMLQLATCQDTAG